jgi:hypothetical protein
MSEVKKVTFENSDFKFTAAYNEYLKNFQATEEDEEKTRLNTLITSLNNDEISYPNFYNEVKGGEDMHRFHRSKITSVRKYQYRKDELKAERSKRHK